MTDRELFEKALEALEHLNRTGDTQVFDLCYAPELIPALRAALAQQAEPEEPVAQYSDIVSDGGMDPRNKYDTAPPQRTMVPLTEEEINRIDVCIDESTPLKEGKSLFARAIENASWEKNHGQT